MKSYKCNRCGKEVPMNDMFQASNKFYCETCCEEGMQDSENPLEGNIESLIDPTVCANCGYDNGSTQLSMISKIPFCPKCDDYFKNRPFPNWIKVSFAALVVLIIFSIFWNLRYIRAYSEIKNSYEFLSKGSLERASSFMLSAADRIPESKDTQIMADYLYGILLLSKDEPRKALECLNRCKDKLPAEYGVEIYTLQAKAGIAFDLKRYDEFLTCAKLMVEKTPNDYMSNAMLASAYACKYAENGDLKSHEQALSALSDARKQATNDPNFIEYEDRILYRLHSREIVTAEVFYRQFPNGWYRHVKK